MHVREDIYNPPSIFHFNSELGNAQSLRQLRAQLELQLAPADYKMGLGLTFSALEPSWQVQ